MNNSSSFGLKDGQVWRIYSYESQESSNSKVYRQQNSTRTWQCILPNTWRSPLHCKMEPLWTEICTMKSWWERLCLKENGLEKKKRENGLSHSLFFIFKRHAKTKLNIYVYIYIYVFVLELQCEPSDHYLWINLIYTISQPTEIYWRPNKFRSL